MNQEKRGKQKTKKKPTQAVLVRMCKNWKLCAPLWEYKMVQRLWKTQRRPSKTEHRITIWPSIPTPESRAWNRDLHTGAQSNIIHNSRKVETTQMSTVRWINKMGCRQHGGILFDLKKESYSDACYNTDEPWGHYEKCNKPVPKTQTPHDPTYRRHPEQSNS